MKSRTILYADEGKILTDGKIYGKQILLADGVSDLSFYEITEEWYQKMLDKQEKEMSGL